MREECIIHGCVYATKRKWNLYTHLQRKHQYPDNLIDSMKKLHNSFKVRARKDLAKERDYQFKCEGCGTAYPNRKRLNEHYKRRHPNQFTAAKSSQVACPLPKCAHTCQTREQLANHAHAAHASLECPYNVRLIDFHTEQEYLAWKEALEKATDSVFSVNSSTPAEADTKRVYLWCDKANKVRSSKPIPESERKRFGNYRGRTKRVQSHCTAFITVWYHQSGIQAKYCSDHIGHNRSASEQNMNHKNAAKRDQADVDESDDLHSDDEDNSDIDVGHHIDIDHEEYVEDDGVVEQAMYSDEEEDDEADKSKQPIRYLTATDRMRPHLNPASALARNTSYAMEEEEYEEEDVEEEEDDLPSQPSTSSLRYLPVHALQQPHSAQGLPQMGYQPRPVLPHMSSDEKETADLSMLLLRESRDRAMHAAKTKKERAKVGRFNHQLQPAIKQFDAPVRRIRQPSTKNESMAQPKEQHDESLYHLHPEDVRQEEEVIEEAVYDDLPGTSYQVYYEQ